MNRREFLKNAGALSAAATLYPVGHVVQAQSGGTPANGDQPNILWIVIEDISAHLSCYGETTIETPRMDQLAAEGTLFERAYITAPVCSPARSAMVTGMYQTSINAHHHRSGRGEKKIHLPDHVELVPAMMQQAGYWTGNGHWPPREPDGPIGKTDFNFEWDRGVYEGNHWDQRDAGKPFFHQLHLEGGKLRDVPAWLEDVYEVIEDPTSPDDVNLPPYYPDHPDIRQDWAEYLDSIRYTDKQVGEIVDHLEEEGLLDNTVIILMSDHGISHARGKQFLYEEGVHIPFIVRGPGIPAGERSAELIEHIDMAATTLALGGVDVPGHMHGQDLFGAGYESRGYVFFARDRCDETVDRIRGMRGDRYKYIRNFYPDRPYLQPNAYADNKPTLQALREWHEADKLNEHQALIMAETRPREELYDLHQDPHELNNLAGDPAHKPTLLQMRQTLEYWMEATNDHGEESEEMYDSDMEVYVNRVRANNPERAEEIEANIELMKQWAAEGK